MAGHPYSGLVPQIHFYKALNAFDRQDFKSAIHEFGKVAGKRLPDALVAEYSFKEAYSYFEEGDLLKAKSLFEKADKMAHSDYTAPSRYSLGYINYTERNFDEAYEWFAKAGSNCVSRRCPTTT